MEQKKKARPQERRSRKFEKEASRRKRPQMEAEPKRREEPRELPDDVLVGRNAVTEALKSGRGINKLWIASGDREGSVSEIAALAKERGIVVQYVERAKIEALAGGHRHQGVLAYVAPVPYAELDDILKAAEEKGEAPFLVLLDELEDPHNLGALLRTADATGVHGILIPKRRSPQCDRRQDVGRRRRVRAGRAHRQHRADAQEAQGEGLLGRRCRHGRREGVL